MKLFTRIWSISHFNLKVVGILIVYCIQNTILNDERIQTITNITSIYLHITTERKKRSTNAIIF